VRAKATTCARLGSRTREDAQKTRLIFQEPKTEQSRRTLPIHTDVVEELQRHKARQAQERLLLGQAYERIMA
jgi:integrase